MDMNCLIDFAYRNICLLNFLENSLKNWDLVLGQHPSETIKNKQSIFRKKNEANFIEYLIEEKNCGIYTEQKIQIKKNKIREWAKAFNQVLSKKLEVEELNSFVDKTLYHTFIDKLDSLKKISNSLIEILFPQLLNNLSASFKLLNQLKISLLFKLKEEIKNYNALLIKSISDGNIEKKLNESQAMLSIANKRIEEQKAKYEEKIKSMQEIINQLQSENSNLNQSIQEKDEDYTNLKIKYNALFNLNTTLTEANEYYSSDHISLNNENKYLKDKK